MVSSDHQEDDSPMFLGEQMPPLDPEMPFNPFLNTEGSIEKNYEVMRTILLIPLFILRMSFLVLFLIVAIVFTKAALFGKQNILNTPLPRWRRKLLWPVRLLARAMLFVCGYHYIDVKGTPAHKKDAPVLVCNHVTFIDPIYIFYRHLPGVVTAEENLNYPLAGTIIAAMQPVTIKRESRESRKKAAVEIRRRTSSPDWSSSLMIFPEATTTNGKALVSFKIGAFSTGSSVQPMVIKYPHIHLDPSWVSIGPSVYTLLFRLMTQFHNYMEVEYLPVMKPTTQEMKNPKAFAERVRAAMAKAMNVSVTEHTFDDISMVDEAQRTKSGYAWSLLEFGRFERLYKMTKKEAKRFFHKFQALDGNKTGIVSLEELIAHLELPDCEPVRKLYRLFDTRGCGYFNFREYTAGLLFISRNSQFSKAMEVAYGALDPDQDGVVNAIDFCTRLKAMVPGTTMDQAKVFWHRINVKHGRLLYRIEVLTFLERNPEYVAVFLYANPGLLLPNLKSEVVEDHGPQ